MSEKIEEVKKAPKSQASKEVMEQIALRIGTPDWALAAAKAVNGWGVGKELTEEEFKAGVDAAINKKINPS